MQREISRRSFLASAAAFAAIAAVNLSGWGLSDSTARPLKWAFPDVTLEPGEYMVVFASGKNRFVDVVSPHSYSAKFWKKRRMQVHDFS